MPENDYSQLKRMCRHCGALDTKRLGLCSVCSLTVCESCGNIQHAGGEIRITHNACLRDDDAGFSMIKFVK